MAFNDMTFKQSATLLNSIMNAAQGGSGELATNESEFVSYATTALETGYDQLTNAISQVISRTIFSSRPYNGKLSGIQYDSEKWGNHIRKINYLDLDIEDDERFTLTDGASVDMYKVNKPVQIQTNFYGGETHQIHFTIYKDQLDAAFQSSAQFGSYMSGLMQNIYNQIEQINETERRMVLAQAMNSAPVQINLNEEYFSFSGTSLAGDAWKQPENIENYVKWFYGYINTLISYMGNRSSKYHFNPTTYNGSSVKPIMRSTPRSDLKVYLLTDFMNIVNASALSSIFNEELLRIGDYENVDFWQDLNSPSKINTQTVAMSEAGVPSLSEASSNNDYVVGAIFDREALGITVQEQWSGTTPFNPAGGYWNTYYHWQNRYWTDLTENMVTLYTGAVSV